MVDSGTGPIVLHPSRFKAILMILGGCAFVACGIWMVTAGEWFGYVAAGFFALVIPVGIVQLIPGSAYLRIEPAGITYANLFRPTSLPWSAVDEFVVVTMKQTGLKVHEMVGINFSENYNGKKTLRAVNQALCECDGALPDTYGMKAKDLAQLLNERLDAARGRR